jgi:cold shock CspA family protein
MRFEGTLTTWNDDRGFGHIQPTQGGAPVFVHISAWPKGAGRPQLKQAVSFELEQGAKGKRARKVVLLRGRRAAISGGEPLAPAGAGGRLAWGAGGATGVSAQDQQGGVSRGVLGDGGVERGGACGLGVALGRSSAELAVN